MTIEEFVNRENDKWGFEYIESLFNRGYEPILLNSDNGDSRWFWQLTPAQPCATLGTRGGQRRVLPFHVVSRS